MSVLDNIANQFFMLTNNPVVNNINRVLSQDLVFTLLFMFQMIFGSLGVSLIPERVHNLANNPVTRLFLLTLIGFVATRNVGLAVVGALSFAALLLLLRNSEEMNSAPLV